MSTQTVTEMTDKKLKVDEESVNSDGVPLFPSFDVMKLSATDMLIILEQYLGRLWSE